MTRRRVLFIAKDGRRYISEELNGDKSEMEQTGSSDRCSMDWNELVDTCYSHVQSYYDFIRMNVQACGQYSSFLGLDSGCGVVHNIPRNRELPPADEYLFIVEGEGIVDAVWLDTFPDDDADYSKVFYVRKDWLLEILDTLDGMNERKGVDLDNFLENYIWDETYFLFEQAKNQGKLLAS